MTQSAENQGVTLISFEAQSVKRIKVFSRTFGAGLTVIGGNNKNGKTSVLNGIQYTLGGEKNRPSSFRNDELGEGEYPYLRTKLSNGYVVERKGKNSSLVATDKDGKKLNQTALNEIITEFSLDIGTFLNASDVKKRELIIKALGDSEALDLLTVDEKKLVADRAFENRIAKDKQVLFDKAPFFPDAPKEIVSRENLSAEYEKGVKNNQAFIKLENEIDAQKDKSTGFADSIKDLKSDIEELRNKISVEEKNLSDSKSTTEGLEFDFALMQETDLEEVNNKLSTIDSDNKEVEANAAKEQLRIGLRAAEKKVADLEIKVKDVREKKNKIIKTDKASLPGLSWEDEELLYNGKAWDSISGAEQFMVATSISRVLSPNCNFVLADACECLDLPNLKLYDQWMRGNGLQGVTTRVSTGDECSLIIEDGEVI